MRNTSPGPSVAIRSALLAVMLALTALMLAVIGCTGAQASPGTQTTQSTATMVPAAASHVPTKCAPGTDKVQLERNAVSPQQAHLQQSRGTLDAGHLHHLAADDAAMLLRDRIPAALTHLDLGIVRT